MNINDIRAFVAVAETGSLSHAAARLHLTQPALTRRIQNFESQLGTALLDRATKPPTLTRAGHRTLDLARRTLRSVAELESSCLPENGAAGPLRLGIAHGLAELALAEPLEVLRNTFSSLQLFVRTEWTSAMMTDLEAGALDCVIGFYPSGHVSPNTLFKTIAQEEVVVIAPPGWAEHHTSTVREISKASWVLNPSSCAYRTALQSAFDSQNTHLDVSMEVIGRELQLSLVSRGAGLGLCPLHALADKRVREQVSILKLTDLGILVDVAMVCSADANDLSAVFQSLFDGVSKHYTAH